jgi:hypothetical protein
MLILGRGKTVQTPPAVGFQPTAIRCTTTRGVKLPRQRAGAFRRRLPQGRRRHRAKYFAGGQHVGYSPDPSQTGDMFEQMVGSCGGRSKA